MNKNQIQVHTPVTQSSVKPNIRLNAEIAPSKSLFLKRAFPLCLSMDASIGSSAACTSSKSACRFSFDESYLSRL
jgi:hypothetical protein